MKKYLKYIIFILIVIVLIIGLRVKKEDYLKGKYNIEINIENYGSMYLELDADTAPITVTNFVNLVKNKFYDGLTIHRVVSGFMIQGGQSSSEMVDTIKGEFSENGVKNDISHKRGVISMARVSGDNNSASSQFFIMHEDDPSLDGSYAAFGHVTKGIEIVDEIVKDVAKYGDENGILPLENQPKINYIKMVEKD